MPRFDRQSFAETFRRALARREEGLTAATDAWRACDGPGDGLAGIYVDRLSTAAILSVYDDAGWSDDVVSLAADEVLHQMAGLGVEAVYVKPFARDRSRLGGQPPEETREALPRAGTAQPDAIVVHEYDTLFEVRPYDGFSTGLFLEHREHRRMLAERGAVRVLNLFAYTCAFSVPLARMGAHVTNVDVSARYLEWGVRNHALNDIEPAHVRYARRDAQAYLAYAARHDHERFDLIVIDPPTFGAAAKRRGVKAWKAEEDYPALLAAAVQVLTPDGAIFAATNARPLAAGSTFRQLIRAAVPHARFVPLPPWPPDLREHDRVAAVLFTPR
ncbi:MAG: class I SAM-dependent methyltransferase [Vicinamibacterales bacterium]